MKHRVEHDLLGEREIPIDVYWGIHTLRAMENFKFGETPVPRGLIKAIALVKKACCLANHELGFIPEKPAQAIIAACDTIAEGGLSDQFPLPALQGGAGTSTNMNVNEVVANRALELMGYEKGSYEHCHPVEHVNMHQSTNDVYPTALKIAAISGVRELSEAAACFQGALQKKEKEFASILTIGRTELQDAVPITLGAQFSSFADAVSRDRWRAFKCEERLRVVNIGGTAVGTGLTAPRSYIFLVIEKLREICGYGLTRGENVIDQTANMDAFVEVSGILAAHASNIIKISGDLRILHMMREISLPPVQAGSSIMPGKVNPVICEAAISAGIRVNADHTVLLDCVERGSLQINEFMPLIAASLLDSIELLSSTDKILARHIEKITANETECRSRVDSSIMLVTAFLPYIGYERAEMLVKSYVQNGGGDFRKFLNDSIGEDVVKRILAPENLMSLGYRDKQVDEIKMKMKSE